MKAKADKAQAIELKSKAEKEFSKRQSQLSEEREEELKQEVLATQQLVQRAQLTHAEQISQAEDHVQAITQVEAHAHYEQYAAKAT